MANVALFGNFRIYPRGFLGALLAPSLVKKPKPNDLLTTSGLAAVLDSNDSSVVTANAAIEDLFNRMVNRDLLINNFDFCSDIYSEVFKAFGTKDFEAWYLTQFHSPAFGQLHLDFIDDCIRFCLTGTRRVSLNSWDALIQMNDEKIQNMLLSDDAKFYFGKDSVRALSPNGKERMVDLVQRWISKPRGTQDLLYSAHILFGLAAR